jgi:hypothetical protein
MPMAGILYEQSDYYRNALMALPHRDLARLCLVHTVGLGNLVKLLIEKGVFSQEEVQKIIGVSLLGQGVEPQEIEKANATTVAIARGFESKQREKLMLPASRN